MEAAQLERRARLARWLGSAIAGAEPLDATRLAPGGEWPDLLERVQQEVAARPTDVEAERVRLFDSAPGGVPLPPYGGWWVEGRLGGEHAAATAEYYRADGLQVDERGGPPDGLAAQLEFLAFLLRHQLAALTIERRGLAEQCREREREFLERFVLPWVPRFCAEGRGIAGACWGAVLELLERLVAAEAARTRGA